MRENGVVTKNQRLHSCVILHYKNSIAYLKSISGIKNPLNPLPSYFVVVSVSCVEVVMVFCDVFFCKISSEHIEHMF